jgi:transposase
MARGEKLHPADIEALKYLYYDSTLSRRQMAQVVGCCHTTVNRICECLEAIGTPYPPAAVRKGRPRLLNPEQEEVGVPATYNQLCSTANCCNRLSLSTLKAGQLLTSMKSLGTCGTSS